MKIQESLKIIKERDLTKEEVYAVFDEIFQNKASHHQISSFLTGLFHKGESASEIYGAVSYLRKYGEAINLNLADHAIDCCGTGGDQKNTFNFSTAVSFVLAGAGCQVPKHGNRAMSSLSGSADVLTELGINIHADKNLVKKSINEIGIGFLFAPDYYPILKTVTQIRKDIGHRTIFNLLGPLLNPCQPKNQIIGVFDKAYSLDMVNVLKEFGSQSVVIVHSLDGMDEFSLTSPQHVVWLKQGVIKEFEFDPRESGYDYCDISKLEGGTAKENANRMLKTLKGHSEPLDHVVHINAAWGLMVAGKAESFLEGLLMAQDSISSGKAYQKLEQLRDYCGC